LQKTPLLTDVSAYVKSYEIVILTYNETILQLKTC